MLDHASGRRNRRRAEEDRFEEVERRQLEDARDRSVREMGGTAAQIGSRLMPAAAEGGYSRSRSRDGRSQSRRDDARRAERRERRRRAEAAEAQIHGRDTVATDRISSLGSPSRSTHGDSSITSQIMPPSTSPRHPSAVEARQRDRQVVPQSSLRSLMSSSESGTGTGDSLEAEQILQQIIEEGLLDGIDVHELDPAQEDALSERIAEAYRQRHQRRHESPSDRLAREERSRERRRSPSRPRVRDRQRNDNGRAHRRSSSAQGLSTTRTSRQGAPENRRPPTARAVDVDITHHRRASEHDRRRISSSLLPDGGNGQASRSATDLSDQSQSLGDSEVSRPALFQDARRSNTEPKPSMNESGGQEGRAHSTASELPNNHPHPSLPPQTRLTASSSSRPSSSRQSASVATAHQVVTSEPKAMQQTSERLATAPSISCKSCSRKDIQYELHKHCRRCFTSLCLRCYRTVPSITLGCEPDAMLSSVPHVSMSTSPTSAETHIFSSRRYIRPAEAGTSSGLITDHQDSNRLRGSLQEGKFCDLCHSFADHCYWSCAICNRGDWGFCNFCINRHHCCTHPLLPLAHKLLAPRTPTFQPGHNPDSGVIKLTPSTVKANVLASGFRSTNPGSTAGSSTKAATTSDADYLPLTFTTNCDICTYPIPPSHSRFHCPSHRSSPERTDSAQDHTRSNSNSDNHDGNIGEIGDYDICTTCYHNLVKMRKIRKEDGPTGWRKCPQGHRMIVVGFEDAPEGQRRIVVNDLVGGRSLRELSTSTTTTTSTAQQGAANSNHGSSNPAANTASSPPPTATSSQARSTSTGGSQGQGQGQWSWLTNAEDGTLKRETRASRLRHATNSLAPTSSTATKTKLAPTSTQPSSQLNPIPFTSIPPSGGIGMRVLALHPWYPEEGEAGVGELMFPRWAEIREVEDVNGDWWAGVYAGRGGVFPGGCGRVIG